MKEFIKKYKDDFIGNSIYDFCVFIFGLFFSGILATITASKITLTIELPTIVAIVFCVFIVIFVCAAFVLLYKSFRKYKFTILKLSINFEYLGDKVIVTSTIKAKARRNGLDRMYNRYSWFPNEQVELDCITPNMSVERLPDFDTNHEYNVVFGRLLKRGEIIEYTTKVIASNKNHQFQNFYSREIIAPTKELSFIIVVPQEFGFTKITDSYFQGSAYNESAYAETHDFSNVHNWTVNPKLHYEYKIRWSK